jgi:hypothetical protein
VQDFADHPTPNAHKGTASEPRADVSAMGSARPPRPREQTSDQHDRVIGHNKHDLRLELSALESAKDRVEVHELGAEQPWSVFEAMREAAWAALLSTGEAYTVRAARPPASRDGHRHGDRGTPRSRGSGVGEAHR